MLAYPAYIIYKTLNSGLNKLFRNVKNTYIDSINHDWSDKSNALAILWTTKGVEHQGGIEQPRTYPRRTERGRRNF